MPQIRNSDLTSFVPTGTRLTCLIFGKKVPITLGRIALRYYGTFM